MSEPESEPNIMKYYDTLEIRISDPRCYSNFYQIVYKIGCILHYIDGTVLTYRLDQARVFEFFKSFKNPGCYTLHDHFNITDPELVLNTLIKMMPKCAGPEPPKDSWSFRFVKMVTFRNRYRYHTIAWKICLFNSFTYLFRERYNFYIPFDFSRAFVNFIEAPKSDYHRFFNSIEDIYNFVMILIYLDIYKGK